MNPLLDSFLVYVSQRVAAEVYPSQVEQCVELHRRLDWGYAADRVCATNDANLQRGSGKLTSLFHTSRGHRVLVTSDLNQEHTLIRLADEE